MNQLALGDAEVMDELFASFGLAMLTGILCIYIVLVLLFKDFLHPFTILTALPLSLGSAFVALLGTGMSFSMPSLIGLIMLMGIATKNSILLVEYAIVARRGHESARRADRCLTQTCPPGHHDHTCHGCGHIADCRGLGRGRHQLSLTDGGGRDRRADDFDRAEFAGDSGGVYRGG